MKQIKEFTIKIILISCVLFSSARNISGQIRELTLPEAIILAQKNSFEYKAAFNRYQSGLWNFKNYKASFLPTLILDGMIPNYSRSINRITLPTGQDTFVGQNQAFSSVNLSIRQNIVSTGGVLLLGSTLNRIDLFGANRQTSYSVIPVSLSYYQNTIGFNSFKWLKEIEPIRLEVMTRELTNSMEQIALQTVSNYFNMIASVTQQKLSKQNLANADTLSRIAKERYKLGTVSQGELLQLRLNMLKAQKQVREDSINLVLAKQLFSRYLLLDDTEYELVIPEVINFFKINYDVALIQAKNNGHAVVNFRLNRLEAEQNLAKVKAENKLKFNINANFGLSNTAPNFPTLFNNLVNQQNISIGFSLPILDWGFAKTQKLRAEANLAMVNNEIKQKEMQLEQEVALHIARWNLHKNNIESAVEAKQISEKSYELEVQRYKAGNISINDLNISQNQKDVTNSNYVQMIKIFWDLYYTIRKLTLYDFEKNAKLAIGISN